MPFNRVDIEKQLMFFLFFLRQQGFWNRYVFAGGFFKVIS